MATTTVGAASAAFKGLAESFLKEPVSAVAATRSLLTDEARRPVELSLRSGRLVFSVTDDGPDWLYPTLTLFQQLLQLRDDWDSYGANMISDDAIIRAAEVLVMLPVAADAPCVVPGSSGSIQLEWHKIDTDVEVHIDPSGRVSASLANDRTGRELEFEALDLRDPNTRAKLGEVFTELVH
jgi:hypothetical protein